MTSTLTTFALLLLPSGLLACTDPPFAITDTPDAAASAGSDGAPAGPACRPSSRWDCHAIGACADQCGTSGGCVDACAAKGCSEAKATFEKMKSCIILACALSCMSGPKSQSCRACIDRSCAPQVSACEAQRCPDECTGGSGARSDGGGAPSTISTPAAAPAVSACYDLLDCTSRCWLPDCETSCRQKACTTAKIAVDQLALCRELSCGLDCILWGAACQTCLVGKCKGDWEACKANAC